MAAPGFSSLLLNLTLGFLFGTAISYVAYQAGSLSRSGSIAAALVGMVVFGLGGLPGAILLLAFFVSSSGLSRLFGRRKSRLEEKFAKGSRRDAGQVLANGGVAAGFMVLHGLFPGEAWPWIGFAASLAAVNADTWATELGVLNHTPPRRVTTWKPVEPGTSGAVSLVGTLAALAGSALIALLAVVLTPVGAAGAPLAAMAAVLAAAGLAGSFFDSFLGATIQAMYHCPACAKETERHPLHTCGTPTVPRRGAGWLNNDWVNVLCALFGALVGLALLA
jgi:uncharacterized protein (TIGR00297 family)